MNAKKNKKISFLIILILGIFVCSIEILNKSYAKEESELSSCPMSEEYKKWLDLSEEEKKLTREPLYCTPSNQKTNLKRKSQASLGTIELPISYDLRNIENGYLPEVKSQGSIGSCYTFAANTILESFMKKNYSRFYDFSERHMEYSYNKDFLNGVVNNEAANKKFGYGNHLIVASYYETLKGPIAESEMPFENNEDLIDFNSLSGKTTLVDVNSIKYLTGAEEIKKHILNYGPVATDMYFIEKYYNKATFSYYYDGSSGDYVNHAVTIIGWDDNYSKNNFKEGVKPENDGAWIIMNSYGSNFGEQGFFYVSYYDTSVTSSNYGILDVDLYPEDNSYYHDYLTGNSSVGFSSSTGWGANTFKRDTSKTNEYLTEIGINFFRPTNYEIYLVQTNEEVTEENISNNKTLIASGTIDYAGFATIKLDTPILLTTSNYTLIGKFSALDTTFLYPIPVSLVSSNPSSIYYEMTTTSGKSYVSPKGTTWYDLGIHESIPGYLSIKGYTEYADYAFDVLNVRTIKENDQTILEITSKITSNNDKRLNEYLTYVGVNYLLQDEVNDGEKITSYINITNLTNSSIKLSYRNITNDININIADYIKLLDTDSYKVNNIYMIIKAIQTMTTDELVSSINTTNSITSNIYENDVLVQNRELFSGLTVKFNDSNNTDYLYSVILNGDVNGDSKISLSDIMKTANYVYKDKSILKEPYVYAADYNLDGKVTLSDIMKIANNVYGGNK